MIGFWVAGHTVYGACVIVANLVILHRFNNFTGYGELLIGLMIFAYFFFMVIESQMRAFPEVFGIFGPMFSSATVWAAIILCSVSTSAGELAARDWAKVICEDKLKNKYEYTPLVEENNEMLNDV